MSAADVHPILDRAMALCGTLVARHLLDGVTGDAENGTGWHGLLQTAADLSAQEPGILRIADDIHAGAPRLRTPALLRAYGEVAMLTVTGPASEAFLRGFVRHVAGPGASTA